MRSLLFLFLILVAPFALADSAGIGSFMNAGGAGGGSGITGSIFTVPNMDQSVIFLSEIFGQVGSVLGGATNGPLEQAILLFNNVALVLGGFVILYTIVVSTLNTAHDGEMLGKKWSSVWIPLRAAGGFSLLLPVKAGGYAFCQVFVMWIVLQGIGAADYVWGTYLKNVKAGNATPQVPYVSSDVMTKITQIFQNAACTVTLSNMFNTVEAQVPGLQPATPLISYPPASTTDDSPMIKFATSVSSNAELCGTVALTTVPPTAKPTGSGISALKSANQTALSGEKVAEASQAASALNTISQTFKASTTSVYQAQRVTNANQVLINITQALSQAAVYYVQKSNYCNNNSDRSCINDVQKQIINAALNYSGQSEGASSPFAAGSRGEFSDSSKAIMQDLSMAQQYGWLYAGSYYILLTKITGETTNNVYAPTVTTVGQSVTNVTSSSSLASDFLKSAQVQYINQVSATCKSNRKVNSTATQDNTGTITKGAGPLFVPCIPTELNTSGPAATLNLPYVGINGTTGGAMSGLIAIINNFFADSLNVFIQGLTSMGGNPVVSLSVVGQSVVALTLAAFAALTVAIPLLALGTGWIPFVGNSITGALTSLLEWVTIPAMGVMGLSIGVGALLGYYMPLVPYILFTAGTLAWFVLVIEAMIAAPIVALGIVHPEGQHDIWGRGEKGIMILISIFLRPSLMVVGFIAGSILIYIAFQILNSGFLVAIAFLGTFGMGPFVFIFSFVMYTSLAIFLMHQCFKLIHKVPDNIMRWIGEAAEPTGQEADQETSQGGQKVSGGAEGAGKAAGEHAKDKIGQKQTAAAMKHAAKGASMQEGKSNQREQNDRNKM